VAESEKSEREEQDIYNPCIQISFASSRVTHYDSPHFTNSTHKTNDEIGEWSTTADYFNF